MRKRNQWTILLPDPLIQGTEHQCLDTDLGVVSKVGNESLSRLKQWEKAIEPGIKIMERNGGARE